MKKLRLYDFVSAFLLSDMDLLFGWFFNAV